MDSTLLFTIMISKEEASCIFYCKAFDTENAKICLENIEASPDVDLCYTTDPHDPLLVCKSRIFGSLKFYKLYKLKKVLVEEAENRANKADLVLGKTRQ